MIMRLDIGDSVVVKPGVIDPDLDKILAVGKGE